MSAEPDSEPVIYKCALIVGAKILKMDVIKHEGRYWLVPGWYENTDEGWQSPERIILLDRIPHKHLPENADWQFLISSPLPKELFSDPDPSKAGTQYVVHLLPGFQIPLAKKLN